MNVSEDTCVFCDRSRLEILAERGSAFAVRDKYPVRPLHSLIVSKRHVADTFELLPEEVEEIFELAKAVRDQIVVDDPEVGGFNFGSNNGRVAGQKIMHVHFHLIPRRPNEAEPPPAKQGDA